MPSGNCDLQKQITGRVKTLPYNFIDSQPAKPEFDKNKAVSQKIDSGIEIFRYRFTCFLTVGLV